MLSWFKNYLTGRTLMVLLQVGVLSGAPQGSILGPMLFVFINYLSDIILEKYETALYADDTKNSKKYL